MNKFGDLVFQPVGHVIFWVCFFAYPAILEFFRYKKNPSAFTLVLYALSTLHVMYTCLHNWSHMIEFYHLGTLFLVKHIQYARSRPHFVVNSPHKSHQLFRYAAYAAYAALTEPQSHPSQHLSNSHRTSPEMS